MSKPIFFLIFDGLNEGRSIEWQHFFDAFGQGPWDGRVAIVATARTAYVESHLKTPLISNFQYKEVEGFTDKELEKALADYKVELSEIPESLRLKVRNPR